MNPSDVKALVASELTSARAELTWHGRPIEQCLLTPRKCTFEDGSNKGDSIELWLVFEELPEPEKGYKIVFDEEMKEFGLATPGFKDNYVFIGYYGTFLKTLGSM